VIILVWFDVNRSTSDEDNFKKRFLHFRSQWPWPLIFRPQICSAIVNLVQRYVSTKLEVYKVLMPQENRRHGTDGRTDGVQRLMLPRRESRIIMQASPLKSIVLRC